MKTLIVAPFSPYPLIFGGAIRLYHLIRMFASFSDVTLLAYRTWGSDDATVKHLETICKRVVMVDNPPSDSSGKWINQLRGTLGPRTFQYYSFYTRHFQRAIDELARREQFDHIVVEQSQMGYFRYPQPRGLRILDLQNIEYELLERRVGVQSNPLKRAALALEALKFKREELAICKQFDLVFTPSDRERDLLRQVGGVKRVETLPNSIDADFFPFCEHEPQANEIAFVGTTHVDANRDGLIYFMEQIFPLLEQRLPDIQLEIVGGKPPQQIRDYGKRPNVEVTGFVDDVRPYMARARALIVPLRSGGGTRLKILEGLSFGVPTVSTSIGAEGIDLVDEQHLLLADDPAEFAADLVRVLQDPVLRQRLRAAGRRLVEEKYSWQAVGKALQTYLHTPGRSPIVEPSPELVLK